MKINNYTTGHEDDENLFWKNTRDYIPKKRRKTFNWFIKRGFDPLIAAFKTLSIRRNDDVFPDYKGVYNYRTEKIGTKEELVEHPEDFIPQNYSHTYIEYYYTYGYRPLTAAFKTLLSYYAQQFPKMPKKK
jgi:hypothetical protein